MTKQTRKRMFSGDEQHEVPRRLDASQKTESRRARNRMSQRASRERQTLYIKELENKLDRYCTSDTGRTAALEKENEDLRAQLREIHKKLCSVQATLENISNSAAMVLGHKSEDATSPKADKIPPTVSSSDPSSPSPRDVCPSVAPEDPTIPGADYGELLAGDQIWLSLSEGNHRPCDDGLLNNKSGERLRVDNQTNTSSISPYLYEHFDGFQCPFVDRNVKVQKLASGGSMSDHIITIEHFLRQKFRNLPTSPREPEWQVKSASFMFSVFIMHSWQAMATWYAYTRCHLYMAQMTAWRLNPTDTNYANMAEFYRPTQLQLSTVHPPAIDWFPIPSIRDKLIMYHAADPRLDRLICDLAQALVVETDLSSLLDGFPKPTPGYVGVWDLVRAITLDELSPSDETNFTTPLSRDWNEFPLCAMSTSFTSASDSSLIDEDQSYPMYTAGEDFEARARSLGWQPAPSVASFFTDKKRPSQAFKLLGMDKGATKFKMHPDVFQQHVELFDPVRSPSIMACGLYLKPPKQTTVIPTPRPLNAISVARYQDFSSWAFDAIVGPKSREWFIPSELPNGTTMDTLQSILYMESLI